MYLEQYLGSLARASSAPSVVEDDDFEDLLDWPWIFILLEGGSAGETGSVAFDDERLYFVRLRFNGLLAPAWLGTAVLPGWLERLVPNCRTWPFPFCRARLAWL